MAEWFATPGDASKRADILASKWNALVNQAFGPTPGGRDDVPTELQEQILRDQKNFRDFINRASFGLYGMLMPQEIENVWGLAQGDYKKLRRWHLKYKLRTEQLAEALPVGENLSAKTKPGKLPSKIGPTEFAKAGRDVAVIAGVAAALFLLIKAFK